jgi:hypothetical protein
MKQPEALATLGGVVGAVSIVIHDYAYRRVDGGDGDYEFGGLITHAGADMAIVTAAIALAVWAWAKWGSM